MIGRLQKREMVLLAIAAAAVLVTLLVGLVWPALVALGSIDGRLEGMRRELVAAQAVGQQLQQVTERLQQRQVRLARQTGGSPLSLVEATAVRLGCRDKLVNIRPQPATVRDGIRVDALELHLEGLDIEQLARLLAAFDAAEQLLVVRDLQVRKRFDDPARLDAVLLLEALQRGD